MNFKTLCTLAAAVLICACDPGSGTFPDLSLEAYIDGTYSGTFTGGGTDSETEIVANPLYPISGPEEYTVNIEVEITIINGIWNCSINTDGTITGTLSGTADVSFTIDSPYAHLLTGDYSDYQTPISGNIEASLFGDTLTMSCPEIDIYDYGEQELTFSGTVTNGVVDGIWALSGSDVNGTFEGSREDS